MNHFQYYVDLWVLTCLKEKNQYSNCFFSSSIIHVSMMHKIEIYFQSVLRLIDLSGIPFLWFNQYLTLWSINHDWIPIISVAYCLCIYTVYNLIREKRNFHLILHFRPPSPQNECNSASISRENWNNQKLFHTSCQLNWSFAKHVGSKSSDIGVKLFVWSTLFIF